MTPLEWALVGIVAATLVVPILFRRARRHWALLTIVGLAGVLGLLYLTQPDTVRCLKNGLDCF